MIARIYSIAEVERMLPLVASIVSEVVERAAALRALGTPLPLARPAAAPSLDSLTRHERDLVLDVRRCTRELENLGAYLRDADRGLVEWYGDVDGDIAYLSWMPGEESVRHWRGLYSPPAVRRELAPQGAITAA